MINFKNKNIVITGASGGIGNALVKKFVSLGGNVLGSGRKSEKLDKIKKQYPNIKVKKFDISEHSRIEEFIDDVSLELGGLDILINNAGINKLSNIDKIEKNFLEKIYKVNLRGPILLTNQISKKMIKRKFGRIINISSIFGVVSKSGRSLYSTTKFGLIGLTKSSALDLAKYNILVNSVSPGVIKTKLTKSILSSKQLSKIRQDIPLKKLGDVSDVSNLVCFLCSELNNYITGQNFIVDGGYTAK